MAGFSAEQNILTLAAYEQTRRALRGECELAASSSRTNTPSFLTTFVDFLVLFSPKTVLSDAPRRTVST